MFCTFLCLLACFFCHAYTAWFDLLEQFGGKMLLIWEHEVYLLDVHKRLLCAAFRIWKRWECSRQWKAGSSVAYCETCFERKWQNKWILKKHTTGTTWTRNCDVALGISNNKRQTKTKSIVFCSLMSTASGVPFFYSPSSLKALARNASSSFPKFPRHFGQQ